MVASGWSFAKRYRSTAVVVLATIALLLILSADTRLWPRFNLAIVYAIPVLIAALVASPTIVVVVAVEAIAMDTTDLLLTANSVPWFLSGPALVAIGAFAVQLSAQRQQIARRARDTEAAHREAQLAHRQLLQFLSMVSHELRQPLGVMVIALEIMADEARHLSPPEQRSRQMLDRSVQSMQRLVTDLHDAARIGSGRFIVRPEPMDLVAVCQQVVQDQRVAGSSHHLLAEAPEELWGIWDRTRVQQLLTNLVSNAIKYSPDGGTVRVSVAAEGEDARVVVADQGVGIEAADLSRLFQPFVRLHENTRADGTGLGLYIAKAVVEAHGGRVEVQSAVGEGSTFTVILPIRQPARAQLGVSVR